MRSSVASETGWRLCVFDPGARWVARRGQELEPEGATVGLAVAPPKD